MNERNRLQFRQFCQQISGLLSTVQAKNYQKNCCVIEGTILLHDQREAKCRIFINENWFLVPPKVICSEKWLKKGNHWHRFEDNEQSLCFVLPKHWGYALLKLKEKFGATLIFTQISAKWMIDSIRWLLDAHLYAHQYDLECWPEDWPEWPHNGNQATEIYDRMYSESGSVEYINTKKPD
jgi:hypothetical protein